MPFEVAVSVASCDGEIVGLLDGFDLILYEGLAVPFSVGFTVLLVGISFVIVTVDPAVGISVGDLVGSIVGDFRNLG